MTAPLDADTSASLREALATLVPLNIAALRGTTFEQRRERVAGAADLIAGKADQMMFGTGKTATGVLSALAMGIAVGAYQPGGVTVLGVHACADPHPWCPASATRPVCCACGPTCTAAALDGGCPDTSRCAWCANGCPNADSGSPCCTPTHVMGRFVILAAADMGPEAAR
ncbi:hypothetical protein FHS43_006212 [Streptosporangium becharense]|uniref:Uncharacterized protein n=1 Tax=Streptosporangium becharense TaxID=1816182 RepID=A0A7W9MHB8_9ACTN|nr:hypothetical protein [Streptosporangium becharense]MBB2914900.1 hypothetical protein [Streptosporangium becharense]MBB5820289.1 hypothetical protein [Streptosporangium becharense]